MDRMNAERADDVLADLEAKHGCAAPPCSVETMSRQVIEGKLLAALNDPTSQKVAILASRQDLDDLVVACDVFARTYAGSAAGIRCRFFAAGLRQLRDEAFPPNDQAH